MACYVAQPSCTGERSALETCMQASPEYETCFDAAFDSCLPPREIDVAPDRSLPTFG